MIKFLNLIFLLIITISCQKNREILGHWHEYKKDNKDFLNCYYVSDSFIGVNPKSCGDSNFYKRKNNFELVSLANEKIEYFSDYKVENNKLIINDSVFWIKQKESKATFIYDFSAGLLVSVNPFESNKSDYDLNNILENYETIIYVGKPNEKAIKKYSLNKDEYYIQLNDFIGNFKSLKSFLTSREFKKLTILIHADKNTPRHFLKELEIEIIKIGFIKNQIYYLTINPSEFKSGYNKYY